MIALKSSFANQIKEMLAYKKGLGYSESTYRHYLCDFDKYCADAFPNESEPTREIVMGWCCKRNGESINSLNRRLAAVREFGRYLQSIGISAYVMPPQNDCHANKIYTAYIYRSGTVCFFLWSRPYMGNSP